jgi:hypothetical protein
MGAFRIPRRKGVDFFMLEESEPGERTVLVAPTPEDISGRSTWRPAWT